jgi:putative acetyltransferase
MTASIRPEIVADYAAISDVIRLAFGREDEAQLVKNLRQTPNFIPELSLVATEDGQIVGHILFSEATIETPDGLKVILILAPLAVHPDHQNQATGSHLVRHGLEACRSLGYGAVVVLGHADYYQRFGFSPAIEKGIKLPFQAPESAFMLIELSPRFVENLSGVVNFPPEFDGV